MRKPRSKPSVIPRVGCDGIDSNIDDPQHSGWRRISAWLMEILKNPIEFLKTLKIVGWAEKSIILLVMQTCDSSFQMRLKRSWWCPWKKPKVCWQTCSSLHRTGKPVCRKNGPTFSRETVDSPDRNFFQCSYHSPYSGRINHGKEQF